MPIRIHWPVPEALVRFKVKTQKYKTRLFKVRSKFASFTRCLKTAAGSVSVYRFVCHPSIAYICSTIIYVTRLLILSTLQLD